jgi:hypothetical protein
VSAAGTDVPLVKSNWFNLLLKFDLIVLHLQVMVVRFLL